jgi:peptidoglycan/LPS O-acetylase OafA/YrhL
MVKVRSGEVRFGSLIEAGLTNALLLPSPALTYIRPWAFPVDSPLWSLSFEVFINIVYAVLLRYLTGLRLGATLVVSAGLLWLTALPYHGLNCGFGWTSFYLGFGRVVFPFAMGVFLSRRLRGRAPGARLAPFSWLVLAVVLAAPGVWPVTYDLVAVWLVFPAVLAVAAQAAPGKWDRLWRKLGELSYPVYVLHYPFVVATSNLAKAAHLGRAETWGAAVATLLLVLIVAQLAAAFYDAPVRRWLTGGPAR